MSRSWWGSAKRDDTRSSAIMAAIVCCENVYARPGIYSYVRRVERENSMKTATCVMRRRQQMHLSSILGQEAKTSNSVQNRALHT